jgi:predicted nucleic acid-binding protein
VRFLDTNLLLRFLTGDDPEKAKAVLSLLQRVRAGEEELMTSETVVAEVFYVLTREKSRYRVPREEVIDRLLPILTMEGVNMVAKLALLDALEVFRTYEGLDFEDAMAVGLMRAHGIGEILSYDEDFDDVEGIKRVEP